MTQTFKIGDRIQASTCNHILTGIIIGFGEHKGGTVIDILADGNNPIEPGKPHYRFVYPSQIFWHDGTVL